MLVFSGTVPGFQCGGGGKDDIPGGGGEGSDTASYPGISYPGKHRHIWCQSARVIWLCGGCESAGRESKLVACLYVMY